jgi:SAM-dependent methyltransferase
MSQIVGATHQFHDREYSCDWASRFVPTPERRQLFETIYGAIITALSPDSRIVELGIGPGYFAEYLLGRMPSIRYYGIDFSTPMLGLARMRLSQWRERVAFIQADLVTDHWWATLPLPIDGIVSTWALHDLGSELLTEKVYSACRAILRSGGILLNGDFIKPDNAKHRYEPGRFEIGRHIQLLKRVGFSQAECLITLESEMETPLRHKIMPAFEPWLNSEALASGL